MNEALLLQSLGKAAAKNRRKFGIVSEMERIAKLPVQDKDAPVDKWTRAFRRIPEARPLRPAQALALEQGALAASWGMPYGMAGSVGVGKGKTLIFMLLPKVFGAKRPIQLLPPDAKEPTLEAEWEWSREYNVVTTTTDIDEWECAGGRLRLLVTYGQLSRPDASDLLRRLSPDWIGSDEAQHLANPKAARTMRFLRYMKANRGAVRFCPMSGTLTQAAMQDYAHLVNLALLDKSPIPRHERDLELLGGTVNWGSKPDHAAYVYARQLTGWAEGAGWRATCEDDQGYIRLALGYRLRTAPGMVVTTSPSCDAALELKAARPDTTELIKGALHQLDTAYELPDGTQVVEASHFAANANHLSLGFYYRWAWEETETGEVDVPWLEARREWAAQVRQYLARHGREGCDSPFLVESHVRKEQGPEGLYNAMLRWDIQKRKPAPPVEAVWFDYSVLTWTCAWAQEHGKALIWFRSRAVGEMLQSFGIPAMWEGTPDPRATPVVALSWHVYHKGWNLQAWDTELDLEPSPNGARWQQKLGRMHRQGQKSKTITSTVLQHTWPLRNNMVAAMEKAQYIQALTYEPQKLLLADLEGFSSAVEEAQN